jgi:hypothetical protein
MASEDASGELRDQPASTHPHHDATANSFPPPLPFARNARGDRAAALIFFFFSLSCEARFDEGDPGEARGVAQRSPEGAAGASPSCALISCALIWTLPCRAPIPRRIAQNRHRARRFLLSARKRTGPRCLRRPASCKDVRASRPSRPASCKDVRATRPPRPASCKDVRATRPPRPASCKDV